MVVGVLELALAVPALSLKENATCREVDIGKVQSALGRQGVRTR